jgi:hypothetical protein
MEDGADGNCRLFRARLDQMIDLSYPLAVLAGRLPLAQFEVALARAFARRFRKGKVIPGDDLFGMTLEILTSDSTRLICACLMQTKIA